MEGLGPLAAQRVGDAVSGRGELRQNFFSASDCVSADEIQIDDRHTRARPWRTGTEIPAAFGLISRS